MPLTLVQIGDLLRPIQDKQAKKQVQEPEPAPPGEQPQPEAKS